MVTLERSHRIHRRWQRTAALAVPAVWAPLTLLHPFTLDDLLLDGRSTQWLAVHTAQLALTPLLALAMLWVLADRAGAVARAARVAVILWAALFAAFDAVAGLAVGILARAGEQQAAQRLFEHGIVGGDVTVLSVVAHPLWGVVAGATAVALRKDGASRLPQVAFWLSVPFALTHVGPLATVALIATAVGLATAPRPTPARASR